MPKRNIVVPTKFEDYKVAELRDIAENEFAVDIEPNASEAAVLAALLESGVTFDQHLANHPEFAAVEDAKVEAAEENSDSGVVTTEQMQEKPVEEEEPVQTKIIVKEEVPLSSKEEWLIKMVRANPLYEVRGYRFTQENPFALVGPEDAEYLLTRETGFRQATPRELQEYYG